MLKKSLLGFLGTFIRVGSLDLTMPDGSTHRFGTGDAPSVGLAIANLATIRAILANPELGLGEAYMDERLTLTHGDLFDLFAVLIRNQKAGHLPVWQQMLSHARTSLRRFVQHSPVHVSRRNVAHHYDLSTDLYDLFLTPDRLYTCAYYETDAHDLQAAQTAKVRHIEKKLLLEPGQRVLDIGCGWGHMACHIAKTYDVHVTGVALSQVQITACKARAKEMQVEDRVTFRYQDYRDVHERFDRVYSVGMLEHVGQPQYRTYFRKIAENLADDGVALVHFIGRTLPPGTLSPWFNKYIFPGGYSPALSEVTPQVEHAGLIPADIEIWRGHYDRTLFDWYERFEARADEAEAMYDATFVRMWRFYLVASVMAFREGLSFLTQMQLTKDPFLVPRTRGYLYQDQPETA